MCEFVLKDMVEKQGLSDQFYIASAATSTEEIGNDIHYGTRNKLKQQKIPFTRRAAVQITRKDYEKYDYLIGMDDWNIRNMMRILRSDPAKKVYKLLEFAGSSRDIADPWYTGNFDETYADVVQGCEGFLRYLKDKGRLS
jgi:protein-tyrosine phosphatase